eukprot:1336405-Amorphochlora_amoeboformis.AAC.1
MPHLSSSPGSVLKVPLLKRELSGNEALFAFSTPQWVGEGGRSPFQGETSELQTRELQSSPEKTNALKGREASVNTVPGHGGYSPPTALASVIVQEWRGRSESHTREHTGTPTPRLNFSGTDQRHNSSIIRPSTVPQEYGSMDPSYDIDVEAPECSEPGRRKRTEDEAKHPKEFSDKVDVNKENGGALSGPRINLPAILNQISRESPEPEIRKNESLPDSFEFDLLTPNTQVSRHEGVPRHGKAKPSDLSTLYSPLDFHDSALQHLWDGEARLLGPLVRIPQREIVADVKASKLERARRKRARNVKLDNDFIIMNTLPPPAKLTPRKRKVLKELPKNFWKHKRAKVACNFCHTKKIKCTPVPGSVDRVPCLSCVENGEECKPWLESKGSFAAYGKRRLSDELNQYKGQKCRRNGDCTRPFRHCGHCKLKKPVKIKACRKSAGCVRPKSHPGRCKLPK